MLFFLITNDVLSTRGIFADMDSCQQELHKWGCANQVTFDPSKQPKHILSRTDARGEASHLLGIRFDCKLLKTESVLDLAKDCRWKIESDSANPAIQYWTATCYVVQSTSVVFH